MDDEMKRLVLMNLEEKLCLVGRHQQGDETHHRGLGPEVPSGIGRDADQGHGNE